MYHKEFYPTPDHVIQIMLHGVDTVNKTILDPSAGSGNLLNFVPNGMQKYAYEVDERLRKVLTQDGHVLLGNDFLKATTEDISHIDLILMNPPFSNGDRHILHAWDIAPSGCEIVALCNSETLKNSYSIYRKNLFSIVTEYGTHTELGDVFATAERKTDVSVSLVRLFKPQTGEDFDTSMFFLYDDEEKSQYDGLMKYDEVRAIVNNYVACVKEFDRIQESMERINNIATSQEMPKLTCSFSDNDKFTTRHEFARQLQAQSWNKIFGRFNLMKYLTQEVKEKFNRFLVQQRNIPFTMRNIYTMMDMIYQTREQNLTEALVNVVDHYTRYTHENRWNYEGWKTNKGYMLNNKFIVNNMVEEGFDGKMRIYYRSSNINRMDDLIKVLCNLSGENYDNIPYVQDWVTGEMERNTWYQLRTKDNRAVFFKFKFYLKGTMHFQFTDSLVWERLNKKYAEAFGVRLPDKI